MLTGEQKKKFAALRVEIIDLNVLAHFCIPCRVSCGLRADVSQAIRSVPQIINDRCALVVIEHYSKKYKKEREKTEFRMSNT